MFITNKIDSDKNGNGGAIPNSDFGDDDDDDDDDEGGMMKNRGSRSY